MMILHFFGQKLLEKYDLLKDENKSLKNVNDFVLKKKDSFKNKFEIFQKKKNF